jgi:hypothetical protein
MWLLITTILIVILVIELQYTPRLDFTKDGNILLWYGKNERKYIVLFKC